MLLASAAAEKDSFTSFAAMHVAFVDVVVDFVVAGEYQEYLICEVGVKPIYLLTLVKPRKVYEYSKLNKENLIAICPIKRLRESCHHNYNLGASFRAPLPCMSISGGGSKNFIMDRILNAEKRVSG